MLCLLHANCLCVVGVLGRGERLQWFWKLPMTLLALRTTIKPDINASPSDLVFGEGITVPGQLIGPPQLTEEELLREQRSTLSNLRVEVERLQPRPTSAHRTPQVHIPEELASATHVLVRKGAQQPLLGGLGHFSAVFSNNTKNQMMLRRTLPGGKSKTP